ncbi:MAG: PaaI family thioesterase [Phycisphaeraceae bacterium]|nr:PaaI family thioesterase [Phycisphaeraceae bacterium]
MATIDPADKRTSYSQLLGIEFLKVADGRATAQMTVGPEHLRSQNIAHGGALASLMDCAVGAAADSLREPSQTVVTIQLNLHFVRAARPSQVLSAEGCVQHAGRRTAVVAGKITDEKDRLIATATATMMYLDFSYESDEKGKPR